jgi:hypothetical protein
VRTAQVQLSWVEIAADIPSVSSTNLHLYAGVKRMMQIEVSGVRASVAMSASWSSDQKEADAEMQKYSVERRNTP